MRAMEVHFIRDCAEMAARASLYRTESRWGLYHDRVDYPRAQRRRLVRACAAARTINGQMRCFKRPIEPYIVRLDEREKHRLPAACASQASRAATWPHAASD